MTALRFTLEPPGIDVLAEAVAPRVVATLGLGLDMPIGVTSLYQNDQTCDAYVADLSGDTLDRFEIMFGELAARGTLSSTRLSELLNVPPRMLSSNVTNAAKKRAHTLGLPWPFVTGSESGRTVWIDIGGNAARIVDAIKREKARRGFTP